MALRRFLLASVLLLLTLSLLSSLSRTPPGRQATKPAYRPPSSPPAQATGSLPADERIRARVGDVVIVEVRADRADSAEVRDLGIDAPVVPGVAGRLEFLADRPGRFPVVLSATGEQLGVILITARSS